MNVPNSPSRPPAPMWWWRQRIGEISFDIASWIVVPLGYLLAPIVLLAAPFAIWFGFMWLVLVALELVFQLIGAR